MADGRSCQTFLASSSAYAKVLVSLSVLSLWLFGSGYIGLAHDARLYALQLMYQLQPEVFSSDLFFASGSQDDFTLFTRLAAPLVKAWGIFPTVRVLATGGAALWFFGVVVLSRRMAANLVGWRLGLIFVLAFPPIYGALGVFEIGRNLATPRVFSEAFVLFGLVMWSLRYKAVGGAPVRPGGSAYSVAGISLLGCAGLLHPLMALPGVLIVVVEWFLASGRWRLFLSSCLGGGVVVLSLGIFEVGPFSNLFVRFDEAWSQIVQHRSPHLFLRYWEMRDWARLAFLISLGCACVVVLEGWRRRMVLAATIVALLGVLTNGIGGDVLGNVLLTQLQMFRLVWPLQVLMPLTLGVLVTKGRGGSRLDGHALVVLMSLAVIALVGESQVQFVCAIVCSPAVAWWLVGRVRGQRTPIGTRWLVLLGVVALLVLGLGFLGESQSAMIYGMDGFSSFGHTLSFLSVPLCLALGALIVWLLARKRGRSTAFLVLTVVLATTVTGLFGSDWRSDVAIAIEEGVGRLELSDALPPGGQIFWQGEPLGPWMIAGRPSYFSLAQGAGLVFNRDTAMEYERRAQLLGPFAEKLGEVSVGASGPPNEVLERLCTDQTDLFSVALMGPIMKVEPITFWPPWFDPLEQPRRKVPGGTAYYIYRCRDVLAAFVGE